MCGERCNFPERGPGQSPATKYKCIFNVLIERETRLMAANVIYMYFN